MVDPKDEIGRLKNINKRLAVRLAHMERKHRERRFVVIEDTASRIIPALITLFPRMTRAEIAQQAVERAIVLVETLDAYFCTDRDGADGSA